MNKKHTPGPWRHDCSVLFAENGPALADTLGHCGVDDFNERVANLALMAAAPNLLEALELCLEELDSCDHEFEGTHYCGRCDSAIDRNHEIREKAAGAIAKAKKGKA